MEGTGNAEPLISVIVPIYNAEKTLEKCIDSILSQSCSNFELLLIDDGSIDHSGLICNQYALKDNRVRVIRQKNAGVSAARNKGLEMMKGEYVTFIDLDDWIKDNYFLEMMNYRDYDLVQCSYINNVESNSYSYSYPDRSCQSRADIKILCVKSDEVLEKISEVIWGKLLRSSIIRKKNIYFDSSIFSGEDTIWMLQYLQYIESLRCLSSIGYVYVIELSKNSLSKRLISYELFIHTVSILEAEYSKLDNIYELNYKEEQLPQYVQYFFVRYVNSLPLNKSVLEIRRILKNISVDPYVSDFIHAKYSKIYHRIRILNWLVLHRLYTLLACYIKLVKRLQ